LLKIKKYVSALQREHEQRMRYALDWAKAAYAMDEVPVGAVVIIGDEVVGVGYNRTVSDCDPSAHAEIVALRRAAAKIGNYRLPSAKMYLTLEPCAMCAGAIVQARLESLIFGATDFKSGAAGSVMNVLRHEKLNHRCQVVGSILENECKELIQKFFRSKR